jgi:glutamate 5-kinase
MAFTAGRDGAVRVNAQLRDILLSGRPVSLLPVGITSCAGDFEKGDLVTVSGPDGKKIGVGIARYGAMKLRDNMGQKGRPEFVHYDHLHIDTGAALTRWSR